MTDPRYGDVSVALDAHVALVEIHRPPHNFFIFDCSDVAIPATIQATSKIFPTPPFSAIA